MKNKKNIFDWACLISLCCFLLLLIIAIGLLVAEYAAGIAGPSPLAPLITCIVVVMVVSIFLLWLESWIWLLENWKGRSIEMNLALLAFIIIGPVFAAYILHFMRARAENRLQVNSV